MAGRDWHHHLPYVIAALGVGASVVVLSHGAGPAYVMQSYHDDAFYYFTIARHVLHGDGSTFDGLSLTNGYHPLWLWLLTPLFGLSADPQAMLIWIKVLCACFWIASIALVWAIARRLDAVAEASVILLLLVPLRQLWLGGMETTLALTLVLAMIHRCLRDRLFTQPGTAPLRPTAILLALMVLARLDLVFLVGAVGAAYFCVAGRLGPAERIRRACLLALPSCVAVAVLMFVNRLLYDTALPVSGEAKALGGPFWNPQVFAAYLGSRPIRLPGVGALPLWSWWVIVILPALALCRVRAGFRDGARWDAVRGLECLGWALIVGNVLQLGYYAVNSSWPLWDWYFYFLPLLLVVTVPILASSVFMRLRLPRRIVALVPVAVGLVLIGKIVVEQRMPQERLRLPLSATFKTQAIAVSAFLNRTLPADAVVAMGDRAGSVGFLLERPLLQTEGLVNSRAYLDALEAGRVHAFLQEKGVDVVLYSGGPNWESGGDPIPAPDVGSDVLRIREPKFGRGPKFSILVREVDLLYRQKLDGHGGQGGTTAAWRYRADLNPPER